MHNYKKLIVALDLTDKKKIFKVVKELAPYGVKFKVGLIAFTKFGPSLVKRLVSENLDVFLDLKLFDIPNTMCNTAKIIAQLGCWAFTVHIRAGLKALKNIVDELDMITKKEKLKRPLIFGVTELTSQDAKLKDVIRLAEIAKKANLDGLVASAQEAYFIRENIGKSLKIITPGIRLPFSDTSDQKRIATAKEAFKNGADYIVVGRPIINSNNYLEAAKQILSY